MGIANPARAPFWWPAVSNSIEREIARAAVLSGYTVAQVPSAATAGQMILVTDEVGGAVPAFSDGTNWRRVTDRAIIS